MKEISLDKRNKVLKMFFHGSSYDDIARQIGIGKGSVVNIIEEFREGDLAIPSDMTEYVDSLRKVAVDMNKYDTSISQVMTYTRLHARLIDIGADTEKAECWIDTCKEIASPGTSGNELVNAAMELMQLKAETGLTYRELITEYDEKLNMSKEISKEIKQQTVELNRTKQEKERTREELDSITKAMATAQEHFHKQKDALKSELDECIARNKLSWKEINLVKAIINTELAGISFTEPMIERVREQIISVGSLPGIIKKLEGEKDRLQSEVDELAHVKKSYSNTVGQLQNISKEIDSSIKSKRSEEHELDDELASKRAELEQVKAEIADKIENLYISHLIIDFLFAPEAISNYDLDWLVDIMIVLRQNRLGIRPTCVTDKNGKVICECHVPKVYRNFDAHTVDIDHAREVFAHLLTPLVKDKFISRFDFDMAEIKHEIDQSTAVIEAIIKERNRHLL